MLFTAAHPTLSAESPKAKKTRGMVMLMVMILLMLMVAVAKIDHFPLHLFFSTEAGSSQS